MNPPDLLPVDKVQNRSQGSKLRQFYTCPRIALAPRGDIKRKFLVIPTKFPVTTWICGTK